MYKRQLEQVFFPAGAAAGQAAGDVRCWGRHTWDALTSTAPVAVGAGFATAVTAGDLHDCALLTDGHVECWGQDGAGQLGDGTPAPGFVTSAAPHPSLVIGLP